LTQVEQVLGRLREYPGAAAFADDPLLRHAAYCSEFVSNAITADPALPGRLLQDDALATPFKAQRLRLPEQALSFGEPEFMRALRLLRRDEMLRIALRDLAGFATLEETLEALSALADFCLREACDYSRRLLGERHRAHGVAAGGQRALRVARETIRFADHHIGQPLMMNTRRIDRL
jgi:glutamine synthetase adenylyltransferase